MYKNLVLMLTVASMASGCHTMPKNEGKMNADGISTTTKALTVGAVVTGVGLVAIPFAGPLLAGAAMLSYQKDASENAVAENKKCIEFFESANKKRWGSAKIEAERRKTGC